MANHFNDLLLQTLKEVGLRLDRVEGRLERVEDRLDRVVEQKADKADVAATHKKLDAIDAKLDQKADKSDLNATNVKVDALGEKIDDFGHRMGRLEAGIGTLKWVIGAEVAVIGVILAFIKAC